MNQQNWHGRGRDRGGRLANDRSTKRHFGACWWSVDHSHHRLGASIQHRGAP